MSWHSNSDLWDSKIPHNFFLSIFLFCLIFDWKIIALQCCVHLYYATTWISSKYTYYLASLVAQLVKNPPAMQENLVPLLDPEGPLEEGMATHSNILTWSLTIDRAVRGARVPGVAESPTQLKDSAQHSTYILTLPLDAPSHHPPSHPSRLLQRIWLSSLWYTATSH